MQVSLVYFGVKDKFVTEADWLQSVYYTRLCTIKGALSLACFQIPPHPY